VAAGLIGGLGATAANASFDDVPNEGAYTEHIDNLQEAGIATGYSDGSFRPAADMNRRQTAAWLDRSAARVGLDRTDGATIVLDAANPVATLAEVEMTSPAAGDGQGWVTLQGGAGAFVTGDESSCPCVIKLVLRNSADELVGLGVLTAYPSDGGFALSTGSVFAAVPLPAGVTETYRLEAELMDTTTSVAVAGMAYGTYSPLADGSPEQQIESSSTDRVESLIPDVPGAP
jgi:hypothetical protein